MTLKNNLIFLLFYALMGGIQAQDLSRMPGELDAFFQKAARHGYSGSVLVAHQGKILLSKGYGMQDPLREVAESAETVFCIGSITKQFTGAAILKLEEQGKLGVYDPLSKFFPEAPADKKDITLHQLLTHSAGFPDAIGDDYEVISAEDFVKSAFENRLAFPPGVEYGYSNVGYSLLGIIVEKVSGKSYEQYLYENLFQPAGMTQTGYLKPGHKSQALAVGYRNGERWGTALDHLWGADGPGWHLKANGGILSTAGDMYKWFEALQTDKVLSPIARKKYFGRHVKETGSESHYGYGWVIQDEPGTGERQIWHNGGNGVFNAFMGFMPSTKTCVIISSNTNQKISDDYALVALKILRGKYRPLNDTQLSGWSGNYKMSNGTIIEVKINELDKALIEVQSPAQFDLLIGDDTDGPTKKALAERTKTAVEQLIAGSYKSFAEARRVPEEMVKRNQSEAWKEFTNKFGKVRNVEILGAAYRPKFNAQIVMLKVNFEKQSRVFTYVWRSGAIDDFYNEPAYVKLFDLAEGEGRFFAPSNDLILTFEPEGKIAIEQNGKRTEGKKF